MGANTNSLCVREGKECPKLIVCVKGEVVLEADCVFERGRSGQS